MSTFFEANQVKYALKMKCSNFCWFRTAHIIASGDGYDVVILSSRVDDQVRKIVPPLVNGVSVRIESV